MINNSPQILHEDADILVINKPSGAVVNEALSNQTATIQAWFLDYLTSKPQLTQTEWEGFIPSDFDPQYGTPQDIWNERQGIVHRLDKDTSGVMVLAKHPGALIVLLRQFRERVVKKSYTCLVHGGMSLEKGIVNAPLHRSQQDRRKFAVAVDGRQAVTLYRTLERYHHLNCLQKQPPLVDGENRVDPSSEFSEETMKLLRKNHDTYIQGFTLLSCQPKTGRTHQIRVHMAHLHHAIVGDQVYGGKRRSKLDELWCPRQFLHASELSFMHPRTKELVQFSTQLPDDLTAVLRRLG